MYNAYLRIEDLRLIKSVTLFVYNGTVTVSYEALTGKLKAVYLVLKSVYIYDEVVLYYTELLVM